MGFRADERKAAKNVGNMEIILSNYLEKIDKYLKPIGAAERADIINEIKSEMLELEVKDKLSPEQIVERLGNPRELAGAYLGQSITKNNSFNLRKLGTVIAFYSLAGLGSIFILPFISVLGAALMFCGVIVPIGGAVKLLGALVGIDVPWVVMQIGSYIPSPIMAFPLSILVGILLFLAGRFFWKLTIRYIQMISNRKKQL